MIKLLKHSTHLHTLFITICVITIFSKHLLQTNHIDSEVLMGANAILYLISLVSMNLQIKGMENSNPNVFIRSVMGSMMVKMFIVVIAVFIYVALSGNQFNKRGIFISLFFYLLYLATEVYVLMKLNNQKNA
jgi:heme/copper-type cytochrome/quinol oxidase subunit 3